jgi:hypothetical protein
MGDGIEIRLRFEDAAALTKEIEQNLGHARAFSPEPRDLPTRSRVDLILETPFREHRLIAEVVMVAQEGPMRGVGLSLPDFDDAARAALQAFQAQAFESPVETETETETETEPPTEGANPPQGAVLPVNRQVTIRKMSLPEQVKLARSGELQDRVVLERVSGKAVWEALLRNPRITTAEVARIARKGTVPRPVIEQIVDNAAWSKTSLVRRALLSNPKLGTEMLMKVLKFAPKHELKAMLKNTSYPQLVRATVQKMLPS